MRSAMLGAAFALALVVGPACREEGEAEKLGRKLDDAMERVEDEARDLEDDLERTADDIEDEAEERADEFEDKFE